MERDRPLTDDEMAARFLHNAVILDDGHNPGIPLPDADDVFDDDDPVLALLEDLDTPLTAEQEFRIRPAPPSVCLDTASAPLAEATAEEARARLDAIKKAIPRFQLAADEEKAREEIRKREADERYFRSVEEHRAHRAELERKRYVARLDREEAEAKAAGRPFRRHKSRADMSPEERKARKAEQDKQAQQRRRARLRNVLRQPAAPNSTD